MRPSRPAARRCGIIVRPPANSAISSTRFRSMIAKAKNARRRVAVELCGDLPRTDAQPSGARNARSESQDCRAFAVAGLDDHGVSQPNVLQDARTIFVLLPRKR